MSKISDWKQDRRVRQIQAAKMADLQAKIDALFPLEASDVLQARDEFTRLNRELTWRRQQPLRYEAAIAGIEILPEWFEPLGQGSGIAAALTDNLRPDAEARLKRELRKHKEQRWEFWSKLIVPYLALLLSILALFLKLK